jgi:hypothetical protein
MTTPDQPESLRRAYAVVVDGRPTDLVVVMPRRISFTPAVADQEAHHALTTWVARGLRPHLTGTFPERRLVRGDNGEITRIVDVPSVSAEELALRAGDAIARQILTEGDTQ